MTRKTRRLALIVALLLVVSGTAVLVSVAFRSSIAFFVTPSELIAGGGTHNGGELRIGGLVQDGSVQKAGDDVRFRVTDLKNAVEVHYKGILPDLFREGQGVVAEGRMNDGTFEASQVLAKHDERYMPPEAVEALKRAGEWHPEASRAASLPKSGS